MCSCVGCQLRQLDPTTLGRIVEAAPLKRVLALDRLLHEVGGDGSNRPAGFAAALHAVLQRHVPRPRQILLLSSQC